MALIYVRSKPDRRAYYEGRVIPADKFVPVVDTPYIRRLIDHWQDIEVEGEGAGRAHKPGKSPSRPTAPRPESPTQ